MWGTGASSTQCEGAAPASDYIDWERAGKAPTSGDGNGFATRYAEDFALYASLGLTHHRLSFEWARLEPSEGTWDAAAVAHYRDVLSAAHDLGVTPWVCLHHFTLPRWFADTGGFLVEANRDRWRRHVDRVAETFGDLVGGWKPINEFNFYARIAYGGGLPPGGTREQQLVAHEAIHLANAEAAVRLKQTGAPVSSVFALAGAVAQDDSPETAARVARVYEASWDPGIGLFRDGVLRVEGREPIERPDLAGSFDMVGFSYYATMGVRDGQYTLHPPGADVSPLGYGIFAEGLGIVLDRLHAELPGTPLLVAEFGVGTDDDAVRVDYIARGLQVVQDALASGIDVRGLFHWTGVDNYEWLHGYDVKFGIIDADRRVRPSAAVLSAEAR